MSEELGLIRDALKSTGKVLLITNGGKQSLFWKKTLEEHSYKVGVVIEAQKYCSLSVLESYIEQKNLNRKEIIFGLKMLFWLEKTSTGLLDELKYYGEERVMVELFRSEEDEYSHFRTSQEAHIQESDILIADPWMKELRKHSLLEIRHVTIFRDIAEIEDTIRRSESVKISFRELNSDINYLIRHSILSITFQEKASFALAYFQDLIEHIHVRPT